MSFLVQHTYRHIFFHVYFKNMVSINRNVERQKGLYETHRQCNYIGETRDTNTSISF